MGRINTRRMWLGALGGWVVLTVWSAIINMGILPDRYAAAQKAGLLLAQPRYGFFLPAYFIALLVVACVLAWIYAGVRATYGPGPGTALKVGLLVGFVAGFPMAFSQATWGPLSRAFPFWWMLELWVGSILSAYVSAWLYRDA